MAEWMDMDTARRTFVEHLRELADDLEAGAELVDGQYTKERTPPRNPWDPMGPATIVLRVHVRTAGRRRRSSITDRYAPPNLSDASIVRSLAAVEPWVLHAVKRGRVVAACTSHEALDAALRLLGAP